MTLVDRMRARCATLTFGPDRTLMEEAIERIEAADEIDYAYANLSEDEIAAAVVRYRALARKQDGGE